MFGFIFGTLCLIALIKVLKHGHGCHGGGGRRRWIFRRFFHRLETTPDQEKVILEAFESLQAKKARLWEELGRSKADLAGSLRSEGFDDAGVRSAFERHDQLLQELRASLLDEMTKVHEALNPGQRQQLAGMLENPHGHRFGPCGYGSDAGCAASC